MVEWELVDRQPGLMIVSPSMYVDLMVLDHPGDPYWLERQRVQRREWMVRTLRAGAWPWSRGPKGRLP